MNKVFVIDADRKPQQPVDPVVARHLLKEGAAAIIRRFPFTIILKDPVPPNQPTSSVAYRLKIDPGSSTTGLSILKEDGECGVVVFAAHIQHRGSIIKDKMNARRSLRRGRRARHTRYRPARFNNRKRTKLLAELSDNENRTSKGWLPPSLESRLANITTWTNRMRRVCPITAISEENVKFDMQAMNNPEIGGTQYQQGTLYGYEVREYLLEKYHHRCVYCSGSTRFSAGHSPLQIEHIIPRARGGTDSVSNLTIACDKCNQKKGTKTAVEFGFPDVQRMARLPYTGAAQVNAMRWELWRRLNRTGLPVEVGTGGRTKFNRTQRGLPKDHWVDAICVGASTPERLVIKDVRPLLIRATGHGKRQRCQVNKYGFPIAHLMKNKSIHGFRSGDMVKAVIPRGKYAGTRVGKIAIRATGAFNMDGVSVNHKYMTKIHASDGYSYLFDSANITRSSII